MTDGGAVEGAEGGQQGLNLLRIGGFIKFSSEGAKVLNVLAGFVCRTNLIQPLLDCDPLIAIEAPSAPTQIQECLDQMFLGTPEGLNSRYSSVRRAS